MNIETISIIVTVFLAVLGYLFTYFHNLRNTRRNERLALITRQLNELYGPMFIITQTGALLFKALNTKVYASGRFIINQDTPRSEKDISEWRIWVENVFLPQNAKLAQIIVEKAHLIREEEMPDCLRAFVLHHAGYEAVIKKWELGDFSESISMIPYPVEINDYANKSYLALKREQLKIIGMKS